MIAVNAHLTINSESTLGPETLKLAVFPNGALSGKTVSPSLANFLLNTLQVFTLSGKVPLITGYEYFESETLE